MFGEAGKVCSGDKLVSGGDKDRLMLSDASSAHITYFKKPKGRLNRLYEVFLLIQGKEGSYYFQGRNAAGNAHFVKYVTPGS